MPRKLRVFGVHFEDSAVAYYRIWLPFQELNRQELMECSRFPDAVSKELVPLVRGRSNYNPSVGSFQDIGEKSDMVLFQRIERIEHLVITRALRAAYGIPVLAECDDDLFSVQPSSRAYPEYRPKHGAEDVEITEISEEDARVFASRHDGLLRKDGEQWLWVTLKEGGNFRDNFTDFLKEAEGVTTTTRTLAAVLQELNPYVYVLPNCIDLARFRLIKRPIKPKGAKVTISWLGGMQHYDDLFLLKDVIPQVLDRCPEAEFVTTMALPEFWLSYKTAHPAQFRTIPFAPVQVWPEHLGSVGIDIGLAPLNSARFNDSKSNLKLLEYGGLGIPGVYSPARAYEDVKDGVTGLLAYAPSEWVENVVSLVRDASAREKIGKQAFAYVADNFDIAKKVKLWHNAYESIYARGSKLARKVMERAKEGKL